MVEYNGYAEQRVSDERSISRKRTNQMKRKKRNRRRRFIRRLFRLMVLSCMCLGLYVAVKELRTLTEKSETISLEALSLETKNANNEAANNEILQDLIELAENNAEAKDFVLDYPNREKYYNSDIDLSDELATIQNTNDEHSVPLLMQWDKRWGYELYGDSIIGLSGCGPTCLSMACLYFTQDEAGNPREIAAFCEKYGYYTTAGTSWELWTNGVQKLGLTGRELSLDEKVMKKALDNGELIICSMRPGDFTTTGHYILIYGYTEGGFQINDPNRKSNSEKLWAYDTLKNQIKNLWAISE